MLKGILVFKPFPNFVRKKDYFLRHRYPACELFHHVRYGWSNVVLLPWSPWHTSSCALFLISGLSSFLYLNPKQNPNPKENCKIGLFVSLIYPACGWCRLSPFRGTPMFLAAVLELSVLLLLQHGHALAIFRKERRTHVIALSSSFLSWCRTFLI